MTERTHSQNSLGAFITGVAATLAVGGYLLFGSKRAVENREKVDLWLKEAKSELKTNIKKTKNLTEEKYDEMVDKIIDKYSEAKDLKDFQVRKIKRRLKEFWEEFQEEMDEE